MIQNLLQPYKMTGLCNTVSGPDPNKPCQFPFTYQGESHLECTLQNDINFWCATETTDSGNTTLKYGYCEMNCPRENGKESIRHITF